MKKIICEKCGFEMLDLSKGPYIEVKCPNCGWGWATYDASLEKNTSSINVRILPNQYNAERAKRLSLLATINILKARLLLQEGGEITMKSSDTIKELKDADINYSLLNAN